MAKQQRARNWCFTHNNYKDEDIALLKIMPCAYLVFGKEKGEAGTPHLQGTVVWTNAKSFTATKEALAFLGNPHIEQCIDLHASILYCQKEGDFTETGTKPKTQAQKGNAEKDRWATALSAAKKGKFEEADPQIQISQCRNMEYIYLRETAAAPLQDTTEKHEWYCGPSGTGKSRKAREENPGAYLKACNKWWDHYQGEDVVLLEDFDKNHGVLCHHLKIWGDRYPFLAEIKGGTRKARPKKIIVTSNYHPDEIWTDEADLEPILRRFHVTKFNKI